MADRSRVLPRPLFRRDINWDPFRDWVQPNRIFDQDFGLPPFLEPSDLSWIDWARRRLSGSAWPGYMRSPLFAPSASDAPTPPSPRQQRRLSGGVSEIRTGPDCWKISLDVNHFSPEEVTIKTKGGYLEIAGQHEERQDEHGFVSRGFTRKYKLPSGMELQHISSSLSRDGILHVEAPLPAPANSLPPEIVIPIQVETEAQKRVGENERQKRREDTALSVGVEVMSRVPQATEGEMDEVTHPGEKRVSSAGGGGEYITTGEDEKPEEESPS